MRLCKDISEIVTNKLDIRDFLTYAEDETFPPDFWRRRLKKDFAPLFAKTWEEFYDAETRLESPRYQEYKEKYLQFMEVKYKAKREKPPQIEELTGIERIFFTVLIDYETCSKECYLKLARETVNAANRIVKEILNFYGPFSHFIEGSFEEIAFEVVFTWLLAGFRTICHREAEISPGYLATYLGDFIWQNTYLTVLFPMIEERSPGRVFDNNLLQIALDYYAPFFDKYENNLKEKIKGPMVVSGALEWTLEEWERITGRFPH